MAVFTLILYQTVNFAGSFSYSLSNLGILMLKGIQDSTVFQVQLTNRAVFTTGTAFFLTLGRDFIIGYRGMRSLFNGSGLSCAAVLALINLQTHNSTACFSCTLIKLEVMYIRSSSNNTTMGNCCAAIATHSTVSAALSITGSRITRVRNRGVLLDCNSLISIITANFTAQMTQAGSSTSGLRSNAKIYSKLMAACRTTSGTCTIGIGMISALSITAYPPNEKSISILAFAINPIVAASSDFAYIFIGCSRSGKGDYADN